MTAEVEPQHDVTPPIPRANSDGLGGVAIAGNFYVIKSAFREKAVELDFEAQDALLTEISQGIKTEEVLGSGSQDDRVTRGREARKELFNSFAERVVNMAQRKCRRYGRWDVVFQEETLQAGALGLMEAIIGFAKLPDESWGGFWAYAQRVINNRINEASRSEFLGKTIGKNGPIAALGRYCESRREFIEQYKRMPSDKEIAEVMGIEPEDVYDLRQLATRNDSDRIFDDDEGASLVYESQVQPINVEAEILVERALEFLLPAQRAMMCMRFGIGDEPRFTMGEIAEILSLRESHVSYAFSHDKDTLGRLLIGLSQGSLDYEKLRLQKGLRGRNVITIFHLLGIHLPEEARLPELRERASWHLGKLIENERDRKVMRMLYGLDSSGSYRTHQEIATELGMSKQNVGFSEARILKRLSEVCSELAGN